jgi:hypothetical protein
MAEESETKKIVIDIVRLWLGRKNRRIAERAGFLAFMSGGMLDQLQTIVDGTATEKTFKTLRAQFRETEQPVRQAVVDLDQAIKHFGAHPIAFQISEIIRGRYIGKLPIRSSIRELLGMRRSRASKLRMRNKALEICNLIDSFNAALKRLDRMLREG